MRIRKIATAIATMCVMGASVILSTGPAQASTDVYTTPGFHVTGGREWHTTCKAYSSTINRCRTDILSGGGWRNNNVTYLPVDHKTWGDNPFAHTGQFVSNNRDWVTICNDEWTGKSACRSYMRNPDDLMWVFNSVTYFTPGSVDFPKVEFNFLSDEFTFKECVTNCVGSIRNGSLSENYVP